MAICYFIDVRGAIMGLFKQVIFGLIYRLTPIKTNRFVFSSFNGQYSDSPKAISISLHNIRPKSQIIWLVNQNVSHDLPDYVKAVQINSLKSAYYSGSSQCVIDNVYAENAITIYNNDKKLILKAKVYLWLHNKRKQFILSTWHGSPIKRMGIDQVNNDISDFLCNKMTMELGDTYTLDIMRRLTFNKIEMKLLGTARNDILFNDNYGDYIKNRLNIKNKKVILFAPTFRNGERLEISDRHVERSGLDQLNEIDFAELFGVLSEKFGGDWVFVCRFHYHVANCIDWDKIEFKYHGRVINGNELEDMADYLSCADILISDISSCIFDFCITEKPCFVFFPDRTQYENNERGLYLDMDSLPFPYSNTYSELINNIKSFDMIKYVSEVRDMRNSLGFIDDGNSANRITEFILERVEQ